MKGALTLRREAVVKPGLTLVGVSVFSNASSWSWNRGGVVQGTLRGTGGGGGVLVAEEFLEERV